MPTATLNSVSAAVPDADATVDFASLSYGTIHVVKGESGEKTGKSFPFSGTADFGRLADNDIQIKLKYISRKHARLQLDENNSQVRLHNYSKATATKVNGTVVKSTAMINDGDIITFGDRSFLFEFGQLLRSRESGIVQKGIKKASTHIKRRHSLSGPAQSRVNIQKEAAKDSRKETEMKSTNEDKKTQKPFEAFADSAAHLETNERKAQESEGQDKCLPQREKLPFLKEITAVQTPERPAYAIRMTNVSLSLEPIVERRSLSPGILPKPAALLSAIRSFEFADAYAAATPKVSEAEKQDNALLEEIRSFTFEQEVINSSEVHIGKPAALLSEICNFSFSAKLSEPESESAPKRAPRSAGFLAEICSFCFPAKENSYEAEPIRVPRSADFLSEVRNFQFAATAKTMPKVLLADIANFARKPQLPLADIRRAALEALYKAPQGDDASSPEGAMLRRMKMRAQKMCRDSMPSLELDFEEAPVTPVPSVGIAKVECAATVPVSPTDDIISPVSRIVNLGGPARAAKSEGALPPAELKSIPPPSIPVSPTDAIISPASLAIRQAF